MKFFSLHYFKGLFASLKTNDFFDTLLHSKNYFLIQVATGGLSLIALPIYTSILTKEEYGYISLYTAFVSILIPIITINTHSSISRYYYEENADFDIFLGNTIMLSSSIAFFFSLIILIFYSSIAEFAEIPLSFPILIIINIVIHIIKSIYLQILIPLKESSKIAKLEVSSLYLRFIFSVILILSIKEQKYFGYIYASIFVGSIYSIYYVFQIVKLSQWKFNSDHLTYIFNYSVPLLFYSLGGAVLIQIDRIILNDLTNREAVAIYSAGYNIANIISFIISATYASSTPVLFKYLNSGNYKATDKLIIQVFSVSLLFAFILISFSDLATSILLNEDYIEATPIIVFVVIGLVFFSAFNIYA
ncbi:MAG: oligosaccharide flippase family protein, partial [Candidatus Heimdallarchaeota archaeon]|nr:oligosaccharide flippase family protein [Candidatus Heimdallarchaeota archaeon]